MNTLRDSQPWLRVARPSSSIPRHPSRTKSSRCCSCRIGGRHFSVICSKKHTCFSCVHKNIRNGIPKEAKNIKLPNMKLDQLAVHSSILIHLYHNYITLICLRRRTNQDQTNILLTNDPPPKTYPFEVSYAQR